jgi:soluble lytic murein transglycosylase
MIRLFTFSFLLAGTLFAQTLQEISDKPEGHVKNFLLWEYLQDDVSAADAETAFEQFENVNYKLYMAYAERSGDPDVKECARCWKLSASELSTEASDDCVRMALSPSKVASTPAEARGALFARFENAFEAPWLEMMAELTPESDIESYAPSLFVTVASSAGQEYRREMFERSYTQEFIERLGQVSGFGRLIKLVVTDAKMEQFQRSLLSFDGAKLKGESLFFLALNQLHYGDRHAALKLLERAYDTFYYRMDKDKALFWQYLVTKEPQLLQLLSQSVDINIYSLYANEMLDRSVDNYFITLNVDKKKPQIDITDPFEWERLVRMIRETPKEELFDLAKEFRSELLLPVQAFILERAYGYKMHSYIVPYADEMYDMPSDKKAMMLSLMRQESHFIPSSLSRSYAMGLMQMMPFLVKAMDKQQQRDTGTFEKMFDPETNIAYASKHLDYLDEYLYHPLLIAYAYNGGIGFTKRYLLSGAFSEGSYEPFWSMEMMANSESREYGKKVLANYVIYKRIFGEKVSIVHLFDNLKHPSRSDRFRASK